MKVVGKYQYSVNMSWYQGIQKNQKWAVQFATAVFNMKDIIYPKPVQ